MDQLVGAAEIAERLGAGKSTVVHDWRQRHQDFPQPVARLRMGLVWAWPDVEAWARATGRLPQGDRRGVSDLAGSPASD